MSYGCGVLFICFKVFQNLYPDKRIAPHFLIHYIQSGAAGQICIYMRVQKIFMGIIALLIVATFSGSTLLKEPSSDELEHANKIVGETWIDVEDYEGLKEYALKAMNISGQDLFLTIDIRFEDNGEVAHLAKTIPASANNEKRACVVFHSDRAFHKAKDTAKANPSLW